jgi:hypothetical protein
MTPFPLLALPAEVLGHVAGLLGREDKARLRAGCRALRAAANSTVTAVLVRGFDLPPASTFPRLASVQVASTYPAPGHAEVQALASAAAQLPQLTSLAAPGHCSGCVQALAAACPRLRALQLWALGGSLAQAGAAAPQCRLCSNWCMWPGAGNQ